MSGSLEASGRRVLLLIENESVPHDKRGWQHALALTEAGAAVSVVCPQWEEEREPLVEKDGVRIHRYPVRFAEGGLGGYVREYGGAFRQMRRFVRRLTRERPFDVVQASNPPDILLFAALSARRRGAALVFDHHDLVPELFLSRFRKRGLVYGATRVVERANFALADVVISTNESYRDVALTRGRKQPEDVFVVRNAPDLRRFRPVEPDPALRAGKPYLIVYAGVMGPQDGIDHALRALAELRSRREDWRAVFVGDGDVLPEMKLLTAELGLADDVEFTGWVETDRLVEVLASATVAIVPDPQNPLNDVSTLVKVAEYMAMACPVAAYGLRETRRTAGDAAAYAASNEPSALASVVDDLLDHPERRERMGALGRERVEQSLSWEHARASLFAAYERAFQVADARRRR